MTNYLDAFIPSSPFGGGVGALGPNPSIDAWARENPLVSPNYPSWRRDIVRAPEESPYYNRDMFTGPMTDDQYALLLNGQVAKKSRAARTKGDIARARLESAFLDSISSNDLAGIHDAPDSARQAQLQELLNRDYVARARGSAMSMAGIRRNEDLERKMAPHNLNVAEFNFRKKQDELNRGFAREQFDATRGERQQRLALQGQAIENTDDYRNSRLALDQDRFANQATNLDWKRSFQETQAKIKNARADKSQVRSLFQDAVNAAGRGAPTTNLDAMFSAMLPSLDPAQKEMAMGILAKRDTEGQVAEMTAAKYQRALSGAMREARTQGYSPDVAMRRINDTWRKDPNRKYTLLDPESNTFVVSPVYRNAARSRFSDAMAGQDDGMEPIEWMEQSQRAVLPQPSVPSGFVASVGARAPAPMSPIAFSQQQQVTPASEYTEGETLSGPTEPDGYRYLYRVVNGVPQRTNLRAR